MFPSRSLPDIHGQPYGFPLQDIHRSIVILRQTVYGTPTVTSHSDDNSAAATKAPRLLFCHCTYAQVVPDDVKTGVLQKLCAANVPFEAVADLCEMAARRDPALTRLAAPEGAIKIAACYPRAVKWLFASAQSPLSPDSTEILNMRVQSVDEIVASLLSEQLQPNLPVGKSTPQDAPVPANS